MQAVCAHYPCKQYIAIEKLPPVQQEQKRGKWIESTELSEQVKGKKFCSNCGKAQYAIEITDKTIQIKSGTSKFCPECGARMEMYE
jgi:membrane protease subunit (stomatin/prohibitin family)